jgi:hypothetical protein
MGSAKAEALDSLSSWRLGVTTQTLNRIEQDEAVVFEIRHWLSPQ